MRRDLLSVRQPGVVLGSIETDGDGWRYDGPVRNLLLGLINEFGERDAVRLVMAEGWANGAGLHLGEPVPTATAPAGAP